MKHVDTKQRQKKILSAIVEFYIETALPVGSRFVSQRFRYSISPATIRNVMADLEEAGLITHPHISAGRVPTDKGYRLYVDDLLEPKHLTKEEQSAISKMINRGHKDLESLMQACSKAISVITNVAGVVITPRIKRSLFKHIELIRIDSSRILVVIVTASGIVKNTIVHTHEDLTKPELHRISEFLNEELKGMFFDEIKTHLNRRLLEERDSLYSFLKKTVLLLSSPNIFSMEERLYFDGTASLMSCPEFSDIAMARVFLKAFEDRQDILELFNQDMEEEGVKVHIGMENRCKEIQNCSVITCNYKINQRTIGALGAIGPTRMEYGKVMCAVSYLSDLLGEALEDID
ncbi:MAG: heat-inducible transcriptional repressor HrcA [Candidatus Omnitrophica bacterium]|nr:heat-inducible transcriptional repressor HrcA [Candidatus Omnitrophota bacterium]